MNKVKETGDLTVCHDMGYDWDVLVEVIEECKKLYNIDSNFVIKLAHDDMYTYEVCLDI